MPTLPLKDNNNDSSSKSRDEVELERLRTIQQLAQSLQSYSQAYIQSQQESRQDFIQAFQSMTDAIIRPTNQTSSNAFLRDLTPSTSQPRSRPSRAFEFHYRTTTQASNTISAECYRAYSRKPVLSSRSPIDTYSIVPHRTTSQASYTISAEGNNMAHTRRPVGSS